MKTAFKLMSGLLAGGLLAACSVDHVPSDQETAAGYYYVGYVYDGVSAQALTDYKLSLTYDAPVEAATEGAAGASGGPVKLSASIDKDGRYRVGPLKSGSDFTVTIDSANYRPFVSHNEYFFNTPGNDAEQLTQFWEAYLFPDAATLVTPEITLDVFSENALLPRPTGKVRITPAGGFAGSDLSLDGTIGASVNNQLWFNDLDTHNATKILDITDGVLTIPSDALVYGVFYEATVYSADGHSYEGFTFTAGTTGSQSLILNELSKPALTLVSSSNQTSPVAENGNLVLTFDRDIEFARGYTPGYFAEKIDNAFSINSPNIVNSAEANVLKLGDPAVVNDVDLRENGTSITIKGNVLTLAWANEPANFFTQDALDPILSATWGALDQVQIQAVGDEVAASLLSSYVGTAVTIQLQKTVP